MKIKGFSEIAKLLSVAFFIMLSVFILNVVMALHLLCQGVSYSSEKFYNVGHRSTGFNGGLPFSFTQKELRSVPKQLDWRLYGAVS